MEPKNRWESRLLKLCSTTIIEMMGDGREICWKETGEMVGWGKGCDVIRVGVPIL